VKRAEIGVLVELLVEIGHDHVPDLRVHSALEEFTIVQESGTDSGSDRDVGNIAMVDGGSEFRLSDRGGVHIGFEGDRNGDSQFFPDGVYDIESRPTALRGGQDRTITRRLRVDIGGTECPDSHRPDLAIFLGGFPEEGSRFADRLFRFLGGKAGFEQRFGRMGSDCTNVFRATGFDSGKERRVRLFFHEFPGYSSSVMCATMSGASTASESSAMSGSRPEALSGTSIPPSKL
jgi:hypothetical protein